MPIDTSLINRLETAMPATVAEFYLFIWRQWPRFWANLSQHNSPRAAAMGALQATGDAFIPGVAPMAEELVAHFESIKSKE